MAERLEEMGAFFDARSESYDTVHTGHIDGGLSGKRIPAWFLPVHTKTLLDLGIGTGLELETVFERFPDVRVTGLDVSENMLLKLKEKYASRMEQITLVQESYLTYDFGTARFDAALSVMSLHHYTHAVKTELYRRIYDALKPGGAYVECDYMLFGDDDFAREESLFEQYEHLRAEQALDPTLEYHFDTPCTVHHQLAMLEEAGFHGVKLIWRTGNTAVVMGKR
jgi:tRNA (cmo5U34)-methyltransferase